MCQALWGLCGLTGRDHLGGEHGLQGEADQCRGQACLCQGSTGRGGLLSGTQAPSLAFTSRPPESEEPRAVKHAFLLNHVSYFLIEM